MDGQRMDRVKPVKPTQLLSVLRNDSKWKNIFHVSKIKLESQGVKHGVLALGQETNCQDQAAILVGSLPDHLSLSDAVWQARRETEHGNSND